MDCLSGVCAVTRHLVERSGKRKGPETGTRPVPLSGPDDGAGNALRRFCRLHHGDRRLNAPGAWSPRPVPAQHSFGHGISLQPCGAFVHGPVQRGNFHFRCNTSLHLAAGNYHHVRGDWQNGNRVFQLVATGHMPALESTLSRAASGATADALVSALVESDPRSGRKMQMRLLGSSLNHSFWFPIWCLRSPARKRSATWLINSSEPGHLVSPLSCAELPKSCAR